jgi:hypothetical protein
MPVIPYLKGKMDDFVAAIDFRLNFEDKTPSIMVKIGDVIQYDGEMASYTKSSGDRTLGRTLALKSAIAGSWLKPATIATETVQNPVQAPAEVPTQTQAEYDALKGGNFETFLNQEKTVVAGARGSVIKEKDMIVKQTGSRVSEEKATKTGRLEVSGDQVDVKTVDTTVTSSTSGFKGKKFSKEVRKSEDYGADSTQPIRTRKNAAATPETRPNTYTVDDKTPHVPDMATTEEIQRAKRIIKDAEPQEAKVIGNVRKSETVETVDGITLKKTVAPTEINTSVKVGSGEVITEATTVKLSSGGTGVTDLSGKDPDGAVVVAKIGEKAAPKIPEAPATDGSNYLSMLPDSWADMHWVQKEKFIHRMVDKGFLEFLMKVETLPAIQKACEARLKELNASTNKSSA